MKASWKPQLSAVLSLIGPAGLWYVLTTFAKMQSDLATTICTAVFAVLASYGLYNAKQVNVSNSPTPLAHAQAVIPITAPGPHPSVAEPVELAKPVMTASDPKYDSGVKL